MGVRVRVGEDRDGVLWKYGGMKGDSPLMDCYWGWDIIVYK